MSVLDKSKALLHGLRRKYYLHRYGIDIDVDYVPDSDEKVIEDARVTAKYLVGLKTELAELELNPIANFMDINYMSDQVDKWQRFHEFDLEYLKERGLELL